MSFLIVNSARAASRAFHLNLRRQPGIMAFSRHQFDRATRQYIRLNNRVPLNELLKIWRTARDASGDRLQLGMTHHAPRLDLVQPYESAINQSFLRYVRDGFGINHIFFVVRPAEEAFLSELNRAIAKRLGDWTFVSKNNSWPRRVPLESAMKLELPMQDETIQTRLPEQEMVALAHEATANIGKVFDLYHVFKSVFSNVHLIPYSRLISEPHELFAEIADIAGFEFADHTLVDVKLNGLANRLLLRNPLTVLADNIAYLKNRFHPRSLIRRSRVPLELRFELRDAIEVCNDWGNHVPLDLDCTELLPTVHEDLKTPLGLGLEVSGYGRLSSAARTIWQSPVFLSDFIGSIAPVFDRNYALTRSVYRATYLQSAPNDLLGLFREANGAQFDELSDLMLRGEQGS